MKHFEQHEVFYDNIIRLNQQEQEKPLEVIEDFFDCCDLEKCDKTIRNMLELAFYTPNTVYDNGDERFNLICFCRRIIDVLEAAWLIYQQSLPKKRRSGNVEIRNLTEEEKEEPLGVILSFLRTWKLSSLRQILWDMLECALIADDINCNDANQRKHMLWFYRSLESVLEAGWIIVDDDC